MIFITVLSSSEDETLGFDLGAVDYICKPFNPSVVKARVRTHVELQLHRERLQDLVEEKTHDLRRAQKELVTRLAWIPEQLLSVMATVDEMSNACSSCSNPSARIIRHNIEAAILRVIDGEDAPMSCPDGDAEQQGPAADLERLKALAAVLRPLLEEHSFESQDVMNSAASFLITLQHSELVDALRELLSRIDCELFTMARSIAVTHHEKWNGQGYPKGIKGEEIPLVGRIVAICDVFDALTSARPYKEAWPVNRAISELLQGKAQSFDSVLVDMYVECLPELLQLTVA